MWEQGNYCRAAGGQSASRRLQFSQVCWCKDMIGFLSLSWAMSLARLASFLMRRPLTLSLHYRAYFQACSRARHQPSNLLALFGLHSAFALTRFQESVTSEACAGLLTRICSENQQQVLSVVGMLGLNALFLEVNWNIITSDEEYVPFPATCLQCATSWIILVYPGRSS